MWNKQVYLNTLVLLAFLSDTFCFNPKDVTIVAYNPSGVSVSIPYEASLRNIQFQGKSRGCLDNSGLIEFELTKFEKHEKSLIALDEDVKLCNGNLFFSIDLDGSNTLRYDATRSIVLVEYPIAIIAYKPYGVRISLPNIQGVDGFVFWASINKPLLSTKHATVRLSAFEPIDGAWIADDTELALQVNDLVYFDLHIRRNGQLEKYSNLPRLRIRELQQSPFGTNTVTSTDQTHTFINAQSNQKIDVQPEIELYGLNNEPTPNYKYTVLVNKHSGTTVSKTTDYLTSTLAVSTTDFPKRTSNVSATRFKTTKEHFKSTRPSETDYLTTSQIPTTTTEGYASLQPDIRTIATELSHTPASSTTTTGKITVAPYSTKTTPHDTKPFDQTSQSTIIIAPKFEFTEPLEPDTSTKNRVTSKKFDIVVKFTAYSPKGLRLTIEVPSEIEEFYFWGNINKQIGNKNNADIKLSAFERILGIWTVNDNNVVLAVGDVINYIIHIRQGHSSYSYSNRSYVIDEIEMAGGSSEKNTTPQAGRRTTKLSATSITSTTVKPYTTETTADEKGQSTIIDPEFGFYSTLVTRTGTSTEAYVTPKIFEIQVIFTAYSPKGLRITIKVPSEIEEFYFWGNINEEIDNRNNADIKLSAFEKILGLWTVKDNNIQLAVGDVINYIIYLRRREGSHNYTPQSYVVGEIKMVDDSPEDTTAPSTTPKVNSKNKKPVVAEQCLHHSVLDARDVKIDFRSDTDVQSKIDASKLSYLKIDDCKVTYKLDETDSNELPSILRIKIV